MSVKELKLEDGYGRKLFFSTFAGQVGVIPIVEKIGDAIALDDRQAHLLLLYLTEHFKPTISKGVDEAISAELKNGPKSIMGKE